MSCLSLCLKCSYFSLFKDKFAVLKDRYIMVGSYLLSELDLYHSLLSYFGVAERYYSDASVFVA